MIRKIISAFSIIVFSGVTTMALAQDPGKVGENEEIVIKKKGDKNTKVTVEINDGEVKVNGKDLSEFDDENVTIRKRKSIDGQARIYTSPGSPFRGGTWNFSDDQGRSFGFEGNENRALLGVSTTKDQNGARIANVSKGSAADKAGLKEGDIITRVDEIKVASPEDLNNAIAKFKPEDKATITFKRGNKEQKATATLGKRSVSARVMPENFDFRNNFDFSPPMTEEFRNRIRAGNPRLGIKAQDTEDGKGVNVLEVLKESSAEKAGIKEGDIVMEFDGKTVNSASELADAARDAREKSTIKVKLNRKGKTQNVEIKVPKKLKTENL